METTMIEISMIRRFGILLPGLFALHASCEAALPPVAVHSPQQIKQQIQTAKAPLTIVHVWATWCEPCREEFPEVIKAYNDCHTNGIALTLISADSSNDVTTVQSFLQKNRSPVGCTIASELDQSFIETLSPKWSGALPATFFFTGRGKLVKEWEGKHSYGQYVKTIKQLLKTTKGAD